MKHELKIWPQFFCRVADGSKTFEVRKNDRGFQSGDEVILHEWDPDTTGSGGPRGYTGRRMQFKIGYVLPIDNERVVFSLLEPARPKPPLGIIGTQSATVLKAGQVHQ